jgi:flagellar hook assembly protein FlgD
MKNIARAVIFTLLFTSVLSVSNAVYYAQSVVVGNIIVRPNPVNFNESPSMSIGYTLNAEAKVTLVIAQNNKKVGTFINSRLYSPGAQNFYWNGQYGSDTEIGTSGQKVANGTYSFIITAINTQAVTPGALTQDIKTTTFTVNSPTNSPLTAIELSNISTDSDFFDPYLSETVKISFEINKDANLTITIADNTGKVIKTLKDKQAYTANDYSVTWDGKDSSGKIVANGDYTYKIVATADSKTDTETGTVTAQKGGGKTVDVNDPTLSNVYVTKDSFDPAWEYTYFIFNVSAKSDIKITILENGSEIDTIYDETNQPKDLYRIQWDGTELESDPGSYTYKIYVENSEGKDMETGDVSIRTDSVTNDRPNIYKDKVGIDFIPYTPSLSSEMPITFKLDKDAEVSLDIRLGNTIVANVVDGEELLEGSNSIKWDGRNDDGAFVESGIYEYKLIAKDANGTDTETGKFSVTKEAKPVDNKCAGFADVTSSYKYCEAVTWAKESGIFVGYPDSTFKPSQAINRGEILKVVLEAFDINLIGGGRNFGFYDIKGSEWFNSYLATALSMNIVSGYGDKTFKPNGTTTRVQALKIMLEAARNKYSLLIPENRTATPYFDIPANQWFTKYAWISKSHGLSDNVNYFYPQSPMTRGEMADMLYRFHQAGLDK